MPITKSAQKKLRVDKRRAEANAPVRTRVKSAIKAARSKPAKDSLAEMYSALDVAVKKKLVPENRAARVKARLLKHMKAETVKSPFAKEVKKNPPKKKTVAK